MISKEILKKIRKLEIQSKGLVNNLFGGEYLSAFKGRGMAFSEVRSYSYGDDIRQIDWNVTARTGEPYIKIFEEEREQTLMLCVDISNSGNLMVNISEIISTMVLESSIPGETYYFTPNYSTSARIV